MDLLPGGLSVALYAVVAVCGLGLLALWLVSNRSRRNAGFASKAHLKRQLSAKAVLRASEIRPSLTDQGRTSAQTSAADLSKPRRSCAS
ncbi:hypothetical protein C9F11_21120 [Streptomyces sp. YIM 121038]|uniref:hypothetical protein n=1 Tax=Streptomyces sp. YIM 121038 TaxID=2136401 RepID=UPI001110336E|nr:hypothetical protein [Streptomyces sp. YIM 121038]QCX77856.1 hypothetical protein C9F11_21120 [Streptomyces sp. YIM 121038]